MTKHMYCSLCGTDMMHDEFIFDIRDMTDPFNKYHHRVWQVCGVCFEELDKRRKAVIDEHKSMVAPGGGCSCDGTGFEMIEF